MASAIAVPGLLALTACAGRAGVSGPAASGGSLVVGGLFAGSRSDKGFMEAGWRGLEKARQELGVQTRFLDGMAPSKELLVPALAQLAEQGRNW
jgi:basic membrane protein A